MATCETDQVTDPNTKSQVQPSVFVLQKNQAPLMPCAPARARVFLRKGRAAVVRLLPFVLRLRDRTAGKTQPIQLKTDPGAKHTGLSLNTKPAVLFKTQINHRKEAIKKKLAQRRAYRRRRRSANLRCRPARFSHRARKGIGTIAPSIRSIIDNVDTWIQRLRRWAPITSFVLENVKFDPAKLQNPEISGVEYQRGTLQGFEIWEYLLEKNNHRCAYCRKTDVPLTKDHVIPRAKGGSDRVSNLTTACVPCNQRKGTKSAEEFLGKNSAKLKALQAQLKKPLASAATMNILRSRLVRLFQATGLPVELASGALTKFNRGRFGIPKSHALDAAFAGEMAACPRNWNMKALHITATGRGSHCRTRSDKFGFPRLILPRTKKVLGFQTGDIVRSPKGTGRIAVRSSGAFDLETPNGKTYVNHKQCRLAQRADGYNYSSPKQAIGVPV